MIQNHITALLAFISTNIDDIFILMLFYSNSRIPRTRIVVGQYLGIASLVIISLIGSYVGGFFDQRYVGILGLFPVYLGIRQIAELLKDHGGDDSQTNITPAGVFAIAGVTIANGADNLGVYIPLLTTMSFAEKIELIIVFAIATYVWCAIAGFLASRPVFARQLERYGHIIMPVVLLALGVFILIESGTFSLLG